MIKRLLTTRPGFIALLLLFNSIVLALAFYTLWRLHAAAIANGLEISEMHSRSFENFVTHNLRITELAAINAVPAGHAVLHPAEFRDSFARALRHSPYLRSISLLDEHGRVMVSTNPANLGRRISTTGYLPPASATADLLRIGQPWSGRDFADGTPSTAEHPVAAEAHSFIPVARALHVARQNVTVLFALNPDYFISHAQQQLSADAGSIEVLRYDGLLLMDTAFAAGVGSREAFIVRDLRLAEIETGQFEQDHDGNRLELTSFRASRLYPFVVVTRVHRAVAIRQWQREAWTLLGIIIPFLLILSLLASAFYHRRMQAAAQRAEAQRLHRINASFFDSSAEAIVITDVDANIVSVNPSFTRITGYAADEVIGRNPRMLSSGLQDKDFYARMWQELQQRDIWRGELVNRRKDGQLYDAHLSITVSRDGEGCIQHYIGVTTDVSLRKAAEKQIEHLTYFDTLTRLPNRRLLTDRLQQALLSSARSGRNGGILFIDLDNFKNINDTLGHDIGDQLLQQVAQRLESCVREGDTVARMGGDEFVVMLKDLGSDPIEAAAQAEAIGSKILASLNEPYLLGARESLSTPSIGVTLFGSSHTSADELFKQADIAMYQAKKAGRNGLRFFDPQMQEVLNARATLDQDLRKALDLQQFRLYYQIQIDESGRVLGAEALIRWGHAERGLVSPAEFIPLAEETGLIIPIGDWVLETACQQLKAWEADDSALHLVLAVNVSARQFHQPDFTSKVHASIQRHDVRPGQLKLELTESMLLDNISDTIATMQSLKAIGVLISLDDFGTGYSSLQYLKRLPLDQLKIDQSFVRDIAVDSSDRAIVQTVIAMAQSLGLDVIAEGVETEVQRRFLSEHGCSHYQGDLFGKPLPIEQFEALRVQFVRGTGE